MSKTGCIISHEGLEYLCGLIRDINGLDTNLIDDINIKSNGSYSSLRINTLLNALKTDCNDYTDSLVSNLSRLELKLVTDESSIIDSNILYLYKPTGQTSYNQYVVIEGNKVLLGTTDINMTDYYTITQADTKFVLKTDFDALKTTVNNIKTDIGTEDISSVGTSVKEAINTLNTNKEEKSNKVTTLDSTSTDTQYPSAKAVKTELDKKIDKSSITTTIDYSSTEDQVPSAKSIYYNCIEGIELDQTVIDTYGTEILKYPLGIWRIQSNALASKFTDLPVKIAGRIEITSINPDTNITPWNYKYSYRVYNFEPCTGGNYIRKMETSGTVGDFKYDSGWQRVCITKVADVEKTNITFSSTTNYEIVSNSCQYFIKNGICTMLLYVKCNSPINEWTTVSNVPKPLNLNKYDILGSIDGDGILKCVVNTSGLLQFSKGVSGTSYIGTISYPVENK